MTRKLYWEGYTSKKSVIVTEEIKQVILKNDACIINSSMYSDLALSLIIEIEERRIMEFYISLSMVVTISSSYQDIFNLTSEREWLIFVNFSFGNGKGKVKMEIPMVPG